MKCLIDAKIPAEIIEPLFSRDFTCDWFDTLSPKDLKESQVLITRSNIRLDKQLLQESPVAVVASPSSGCDHFDTAWLDENNITWIHAPGCNAQSVANYILATTACLITEKKLQNPVTAAIIGCGHIGKLVQTIWQDLGFTVLVHDPLRAEAEPDFISTPLSTIQQSADLITLHTPLTKTGKHPSYHLINRDFLESLKPGCIIINSARGGVIDTEAALAFSDKFTWIADVFENEPRIDPDYLKILWLATPHIAGHAIEGKWRGIIMCQQQIYEHYGIDDPPSLDWDTGTSPVHINKNGWEEDVLKHYNPFDDRLSLENYHDFQKLRDEYRVRYEFK